MAGGGAASHSAPEPAGCAAAARMRVHPPARRVTIDRDNVTGASRGSALRNRPDFIPEFDEDLDATAGALELAERHALRRVAGLSTELADITEVEYRQLRLERVVLVGVWTEGTVD